MNFKQISIDDLILFNF